MISALHSVLAAVRSCRACQAHLPLGPHPVLRAGASARILIVGQAPGTRVHATGIPWNDPNGERLRAWMGVDDEVFYRAGGPAGAALPGGPARRLSSTVLPGVNLSGGFAVYQGMRTQAG